ncbi:MAG: N-6 DNA methylase [Pirellulales bacterium]
MSGRFPTEKRASISPPKASPASWRQVTVDPDARPEPGKPIYINDPSCGSGRMLLEASSINPHVELVGQDVDSRAARMTAINLGLRGRYGWVVCGNSLTGETSFAYRVGHFFHDSPNGRRRGVIRDVSPEETPVPVIASRLRNKTQELLNADNLTTVQEPAQLPTIIEVPRWLANMEAQTAALDGSSLASESPSASPSASIADIPNRQQELF